jgi:PAS domain S-box-containing protein
MRDVAYTPDSMAAPSSPLTDFLAGGGEMGERMRALDWENTPLGPPAQWPRSLKTAVRIMLTSRQAMWIGWGPELVYLYNDPYKSIIGGKHPDALGKPTSYVWREIWSDISPRIQTVMRNNVGTYDEALLLVMERTGYPEETYYTFSYSPIPDDDGGVGGLICANTDDTQRVLRERQLALLQRLAADTANARTFAEACTRSMVALTENPFDFPFAGIYLRNEEQMTLAATAGIDPSHSWMNASAWPLAQAQRGIVLVDRLPSFRGRPPQGGWDRPPKQGVAVPIAAPGRSGIAGVLVAGLNPLRLFDDSYRQFVETVSSQIAASFANAQAYEEEAKRAQILTELDRAKTVFFSNVSHELRTPLTLMIGPMEDALARPERSMGAEELEAAHRGALRLLKLVNALLDFSRIEAGRSTATYRPTDVATLTRDLANSFRAAIEKAGLRLIVDIAPLEEPLFLDRDMWEKIVLNLLSNAFKFTLDGEIEVRLEPINGAVELSVRDTGSGIPASELTHVFERFHRIEGTRRRTHEGTGIGLALVQELVKLHGGSVAVESAEGVGTTFTVTIPRGSEHLPRERVSTTSVVHRATPRTDLFVEEALQWLPRDAHEGFLEDAEPADASRARIVLADDNADMRDYVHRLLAQRYDVVTVENGKQALDEIRARRPALLVTDVMMPEMNGVELVEAIRADESLAQLPVIMLSARAGEEARIEGFTAGADDYVVKPFSARELLARVSTQIDLARVRQEAQASVAESERRLRENAEQLHAALEVGSIATWHWDLANGVATVGDTFAQLMGLPAGTTRVDAAQFYALVHPNDRSRLIQYLERIGRDRGRIDVEYRILRPDGEVRWILSRGAPIVGEQGEVTAIRGAVTDITDRKRAEEALRATAAALRDADRLKDEFLATLSHELRTPLTAILGWTHMLEIGSVAPEQQGFALEIIRNSALAQSQLVEDVLDVSRIVTGKMRLQRKATKLSAVMEAAAATVRPAADAKQIALHIEVTSAPPPLQLDPARIQQVLWNLLSNAIKFSPHGSVVEMVLRTEEGFAVVDVRDQGQGIRADFLPYIFHRFRQGDGSTTRSHAGLGLGLALVKELTELHGGTVSVESVEGRGSTFTVRLPIPVAPQ